MEITMEDEGKSESIEFEGSVDDLIELLTLNPSTTLIAKNGVLVTGEEQLENSDRVLVMSVVSGG